jgi:hypothetical protein
MNRPLFSVSNGRAHFSELSSQNLSSFNSQSWFIELAAGVQLADLFDPGVWGPQPRVQRGDTVVVMAEDNSFFGVLMCTRTAAAYPTFEPLMIRERQAPISAIKPSNGHGIEFRPGFGFCVLEAGEIVATATSRADAEAQLAAIAGPSA